MRTLNEPLLDDVPKKRFFTVNPANPDNEAQWIYNPHNDYNAYSTTGTITHLVQRANTLGAEINIAARATILRKARASGQPVTSSDQLIRCSGYGDPDRNSDPRVSMVPLASKVYGINVQG